MNAAGGDESRMPGASGACARNERSLGSGYVDVRTKGGAVTDGRRVEPRDSDAGGASEGETTGNGAAASAARM